MTSRLEVSVRTNREWEAAILKGFEIWRTIRNAGSGAIAVDLNRASIDLCEMPEGTVSR